MVRPSERPGIDVDYLLAQVFVDQAVVDTKPTCGNMMTGVAPFAIEKAWVPALDPETKVRVYNLNTKSVIDMYVQTPGRKVNYEKGNLSIHGVPGTGAAISMQLYEIAGGATGRLFPTGKRKDRIQGLEVSIVDAGNTMVLFRAKDLGLSGLETTEFFASHPELLNRLESIRQEAGQLAGLGDVSNKVLPKLGLLSPPGEGGSIRSQYFTPFSLHPSHAVSGAVCIATACMAPGTIAHEIASASVTSNTITIEFHSGKLPVEIEVQGTGADFTVVRAGVLRTARKIMEGWVYL